MRNIRLLIEYDGKNFAGWQSQPAKISIQSEITKAIKEITGEDVELNASRKDRCRSSCTSDKWQISKQILS